jgi:hypothetical protein
LCLGTAVGPAAAQQAPVAAATPGALVGALVGGLVRVDTGGRHAAVGAVVHADSGGLWLAERPGGRVTARVPLARVRSVATAAGVDRARGARRGALVGGVLGGLLVGAGLVGDRYGAAGDATMPVSALTVPAGLGLAALGAALGAAAAPPRWSEPRPLRIGRAGGRGGGAAVRLAFAF